MASAASTAAMSARARRSSAWVARRRAISGAVKRPCLRAFRLPLGGPVERPPCMRQRPFAMPGVGHGVPARVRAPHGRIVC
jgi:hypothetical protein